MYYIRSLRFFVIGLAFLFFVTPGSGSQDIGKSVDEAMKSRATGTVEEVTKMFQDATELTSNPHLKASILTLLADFLMEKREWAKAIEVNDTILAEGKDIDKPAAYYSSAQAYLMLNQPIKAKAICAELKAKFPDNTMESLNNSMKESDPNGVHARLAGFFEESPSGDVIQTVPGVESTVSRPVEVAAESTSTEEKPMAPLPAKESQETEKPATGKKIEENRFAIGAEGWNCDLTGDINAKGMSLGFSNDTDIGGQTGLVLHASWKFSDKDQLLLDYSHFDHHGIIRKAITFYKFNYSPGASIDGKTSFFDVGLSRLLDDWNRVSWKLLYGVKFSQTSMHLAQQMPIGAAGYGNLSADFEVPYLGIAGNEKLSGNVKLNGSAKFCSLHQSGVGARLADFELAFLFGRDYAKQPAETELYGILGYRYFLLDSENDNDSAKIRYSGPIFGIELRF
ncbi:MAG: hypothetical protein HQM09_09790 [Candidatus Riflebacteria bacterium]|nr:hypothetical protein [Candidatus Riflebacteria bacterium]